MRDTSKLDAAILAHRENPTDETAAAVLAAQTAQNDRFQREQTDDYQRRTH